MATFMVSLVLYPIVAAGRQVADGVARAWVDDITQCHADVGCFSKMLERAAPTLNLEATGNLHINRKKTGILNPSNRPDVQACAQQLRIPEVRCIKDLGVVQGWGASATAPAEQRWDNVKPSFGSLGTS